VISSLVAIPSLILLAWLQARGHFAALDKAALEKAALDKKEV
jgi:hypothetical protein